MLDVRGSGGGVGVEEREGRLMSWDKFAPKQLDPYDERLMRSGDRVSCVDALNEFGDSLKLWADSIRRRDEYDIIRCRPMGIPVQGGDE